MSARATDYTGRTMKSVKVLYKIGVKPRNTAILWRMQCLRCGQEYDVRSSQLGHHKWNGHRCHEAAKMATLPSVGMPKMMSTYATHEKKGKAFRQNWTLQEHVINDVLAYQWSVGPHVAIGW